MSVPIAVLLFCASLILSTLASAVLAERLDQAGDRFRFPAGLLGIVTALGSDAPEIASAVTALLSGQHDLGRGVIFGSNVFNIAMLLGFCAVVTGGIEIGRSNLLLNAGVALSVTLVAGAQAASWIGPLVAGLLLAALLGPYLSLLSIQPAFVSKLPFPAVVTSWLATAVAAAARENEAETEAEVATGSGRRFTTVDGLSILPLLAVIVGASIVMVRIAEMLGHRWNIGQVVIGTLLVATLTGLPNLIAAIRLARNHRGTALASEAFNSNSLNLLVGAYLPGLIVTSSRPSPEAWLAFLWLIGMTLLAILLGVTRGGFGRATGGLLLAAYAGFIVVVLW